VPGWVIYLFQVELDGLREIDECLVNRLALAGNVDFQALRDVPVLFAVQGRGQGARRILHVPSVALPGGSSLSQSAVTHWDSQRYHQQYLSDSKNPYGYCPDHGAGVSCPIGVGVIYGTGVKADADQSQSAT
jgi:hypothetical protein